MDKYKVKKEVSPFETGILGTQWKVGQQLVLSGCMIMICTAGSARLSVSSRRYDVRPGRCSFLVSDMVIVPVEVSDDFRARYVMADYAMAQEIIFMVTSNRFWDFIYRHAVFMPDREERKFLTKWFDLAQWVMDNCAVNDSSKIIKDALSDLLIVMSRRIEAIEGDMGEPPTKNRAWTMVNDFLGLLGRHYARHHDVAYYAERLHVTSNYLNIIVRRYTGTSAKEQINIQLMHVLKMLLDTTDMPVKAIAERLGFDDPSYLCRMFRRRESMTPLQYRNAHRHS